MIKLFILLYKFCIVNNDIDCLDSINLQNTILYLLQASLFPVNLTSKLVFLSKILAAFPLVVKRNVTQCKIASSVAGVGGTLEAIADCSTQADQMIALNCEVKVSGVVLSPTMTFLSCIPLNNWLF